MDILAKVESSLKEIEGVSDEHKGKIFDVVKGYSQQYGQMATDLEKFKGEASQVSEYKDKVNKYQSWLDKNQIKDLSELEGKLSKSTQESSKSDDVEALTKALEDSNNKFKALEDRLALRDRKDRYSAVVDGLMKDFKTDDGKEYKLTKKFVEPEIQSLFEKEFESNVALEAEITQALKRAKDNQSAFFKELGHDEGFPVRKVETSDNGISTEEFNQATYDKIKKEQGLQQAFAYKRQTLSK